MSEHPTPESILQVGLGFWPSKVLLSAVEMELFTDLAKGPQSLESASRGRHGLHPRSARDFLDALVALGFLQRAHGEYSNTPATDTFLDKHKPLLHRRHPRNGEPPPLSASGIISRKRFAPACRRTKSAAGGVSLFEAFMPIRRA